MRERLSVRVLLLSPEGRLLPFKYRNTGPNGAERPHWTTVGGGRDEAETIEQTAAREAAEETGLAGIRLGPIVWYGEDSQRSAWDVVLKEHFIVAFAPSETVDTVAWTDHERRQILDYRWWKSDEIRKSSEVIYPPGLADLLEPVLAGNYPPGPIILPAI
jgi:8-oxo-dGTP pyrophosphatase MutT (NUDIX family)